MRSIDTNILLYALNADCPEFQVAHDLLHEIANDTEMVICDLVLVELYMLLRNPIVLASPLKAAEAAEICLHYRNNKHWKLIESAPIMQEIWRYAASPNFRRSKIIDARLALTLRYHGVDEWITRNSKDFMDFGFTKVVNPYAQTLEN